MTNRDAFSPTSLLTPKKPVSMHSRAPSVAPIEGILTSGLSIAEKRETLSSWASDARAVVDAPSLRRLDNGATVGIDDILDALKELDRFGGEDSVRKAAAPPAEARFSPRGWFQGVFRGRHSDEDDDDPPPCPAVIAPFPRLPPSGAELDLEAA